MMRLWGQVLSTRYGPGGQEFYSDPAVVSGYIAYREQGLSRSQLIEGFIPSTRY
jgi:hypothetical protein